MEEIILLESQLYSLFVLTDLEHHLQILSAYDLNSFYNTNQHPHYFFYIHEKCS